MGELKRSTDEIITRKKKQQTIERYMAWKCELHADAAVRQQIFCFCCTEHCKLYCLTECLNVSFIR